MPKARQDNVILSVSEESLVLCDPSATPQDDVKLITNANRLPIAIATDEVVKARIGRAEAAEVRVGATIPLTVTGPNAESGA